MPRTDIPVGCLSPGASQSIAYLCCAPHSGEWSDLEHLTSRLGGLKRQAIGTALRQYASWVVQGAGNLGDPEEVSDKLQESYRRRSELLHDGYTDEQALRQASRFSPELVPQLLVHLYSSEAR